MCPEECLKVKCHRITVRKNIDCVLRGITIYVNFTKWKQNVYTKREGAVIEIVGIITTVIAIGGVVLNNRRKRLCFVLWGVSDTLSALIHLHKDRGHWWPEM